VPLKQGRFYPDLHRVRGREPRLRRKEKGRMVVFITLGREGRKRGGEIVRDGRHHERSALDFSLRTGAMGKIPRRVSIGRTSKFRQIPFIMISQKKKNVRLKERKKDFTGGVKKTLYLVWGEERKQKKSKTSQEGWSEIIWGRKNF